MDALVSFLALAAFAGACVAVVFGLRRVVPRARRAVWSIPFVLGLLAWMIALVAAFVVPFVGYPISGTTRLTGVPLPYAAWELRPNGNWMDFASPLSIFVYAFDVALVFLVASVALERLGKRWAARR